MDLLHFLEHIPAILGAHVSTILGLVFLDLATGVARSIRNGDFSIGRITDYYFTNVVPFVIGYVGLAGALMFVSDELLPPGVAQSLAMVAEWIGFGTIVVRIFASVWHNVRLLIQGYPEPVFDFADE